MKLFTGSIVGGSEGVRLMDAAVASAIGKVARDRDQPVFAHATDAGGLVVALQAGADVLAHATPASGPWDAATVQRLVAEGVALVPTLAMFELEIRREQVPEPVVQRLVGNAQAQVAALQAAGGQVLSGTDAGYIEDFDTTRELQLLAAAGLDWRQVLASLTTAPARMFGEADARAHRAGFRGRPGGAGGGPGAGRGGAGRRGIHPARRRADPPRGLSDPASRADAGRAPARPLAMDEALPAPAGEGFAPGHFAAGLPSAISASSLATPCGSSCWATWPPGKVRMPQPRSWARCQPRSIFARSSRVWPSGTKAT